MPGRENPFKLLRDNEKGLIEDTYLDSFTILIQNSKIALVNVDELVLSTGDIGDIHVVGGGTQLFILLQK